MPFNRRPRSSENRPPPRGRGGPPFGKPSFDKARRDSGAPRENRRPSESRRDFSRPFEDRPRQDGLPASPRRDFSPRPSLQSRPRQGGPPAGPRRDWEPRPAGRPRRFEGPSQDRRPPDFRGPPVGPRFKPSFRTRQDKRPAPVRPFERSVAAAPFEERTDLIEGRNPVYEALKAGRPINKLLVAHGVGEDATITEILNLAREADILIDRVDRQVINNLSITKHSQGVVALAAAKAYVKLEELLQLARDKGEVPLIIVLDGIEDPHNLGAVIRTAEAAGAHGIVIPERRAVGLTATVARTSAGAMEYVPVARVSNLSNALATLKKEGLWTVGITAEGTQAYTAVDFSQPTALVIGAEGAGLSRLVKERCDLLASIPMVGRVNSLNASVAAALVMYEAVRQRRP